ncbi:DUF6221 family protein [Pseudonocardia hispaniensis]|uniref:DUF6221 family protein n=1 Tax=Pseudonocardia hispaniensis TaxID=904933 RepID=A0ABW1IX69_9PSEU
MSSEPPISIELLRQIRELRQMGFDASYSSKPPPRFGPGIIRGPKRAKTDRLVDFLCARLDENEQSAQERQDSDPALADVAAKRRIVDDFADTRADTQVGDPYYDGYLDAIEKAALMLAQPYRDHPDFHPSWERRAR